MAQYASENPETAAVSAASVAAAVANPAPLGLAAFALTTFVLSANNAGLYPLAGISIVVGLALFYGGLCQLLAGLQEFRNGNTFGATAFCSYGGFWLAVGVILTPAFGVKVTVPAVATGFGYFFLGWAIFTGLMFLGTLRSNLALMAVFGFLFLTFVALTIGWLGGVNATWIQIGGWLGIITAIIAWYTAIAGVLASSKSAFTLPVWPIG
jgi:succinate-acetate transporter protein